MNRKVITIALLAVLGTITTGCQKENFADVTSESAISEASTVYTVQYAVDSVLHIATLQSKDEVNALLMQLMALAREGYNVEVFDNNYSPSASPTKEVVTYTTSSDTAATEWTATKMSQGYTVQITYNQSNNTYTCRAFK